MPGLKVAILAKPDQSDPLNALVLVGWKIEAGGKTWGGRATVRRDEAPEGMTAEEFAVAALLRELLLSPPPEVVMNEIRRSSVGGKAMTAADLNVAYGTGYPFDHDI